ncbi:monofunctional biosynthetic peptidoglycan transglycosylase [Hydrogenophaga sp. T4]|nr:monofunctional biosynthetic peptidoglycan transglycosylase [Hydrogenophaga sp. T4]
MASEDAGFAEHDGVDWSAIEAAWVKNERRQELVEKRTAQLERKLAKNPKRPKLPSRRSSRPR